MRVPRAGGDRQRGQIDVVDARHTPLGDRVERAKRFDLVTKQLDANGPVPVGGIQIDDATTAGERARCVDRIDQPPATGAKPVGEFFRVEPSIQGEPTCAGLDLPWVGERREERLDAGHHERRPWPVGSGEPFDDGEPLSVGGIVRWSPVLTKTLHRGEEQGREVAEQGEVIDKGVCLRRVGQNDDERASFGGPGPRQGCQRQRRRRSPGSADRPAVSLAEGGDHIGKPTVRVECLSQAKQPPGWPAGVMCHACGCTRSPSG